MLVKFLMFFLKIFNNVYEQHTGILILCIDLYENKVKNLQAGPRRNKFFIGDLVRISIERGPFKKSYLEGWSE